MWPRRFVGPNRLFFPVDQLRSIRSYITLKYFEKIGFSCLYDIQSHLHWQDVFMLKNMINIFEKMVIEY